MRQCDKEPTLCMRCKRPNFDNHGAWCDKCHGIVLKEINKKRKEIGADRPDTRANYRPRPRKPEPVRETGCSGARVVFGFGTGGGRRVVRSTNHQS